MILKSKLPKTGEERVRRYFAWLPVRINDNEKVWLEWVESTEVYYDLGRWEGWEKKETRVIKSKDVVV